MRILLVKTSSLGDVIHNLPAVTDIRKRWPHATIDWCVEERFAEIPRLHPGVNEVIPVAIRRWRKALFRGATWRELGRLRTRLAAHPYDAVIDTQGLLKSAVITRQAAGPKAGHASDSAREPVAARFYDDSHSVPRHLHAVERNRRLVAAALKLHADGPPDYGIAAAPLRDTWMPSDPFAVLLTATSRADKLWAEANWVQLGEHLAARGLHCILPSGSPEERARAERIAAVSSSNAVVAPSLTLTELGGLLAASRVAIGVDTGLIHLAAALDIPAIAIFCGSNPALTGVLAASPTANLGQHGLPPDVGQVLATLDGMW